MKKKRYPTYKRKYKRKKQPRRKILTAIILCVILAVCLSLIHIFTRGVRKLTDLDAPAIAAAMERGVETAYKAVMKPKELSLIHI